jgi:phosphatidylserine/phosphatidylglycerophosphate/cardiolipin synthase-like enzyme
MLIFQLLFFLFTWTGSQTFASAAGPYATVYFSPDDHLEKRLIELIEKEKTSIQVCIYTFTHRSIANALIEAKKRGVDVEVIVDRFSVKIQSPLQKLIEANIPVQVWDPDRLKRKQAHRPLMHNKFCVFGSDTVWTGSFNFTYEASKMHQENALVLRDSALAAAYKGQFYTIKLRNCIPLASFIAAHPNKKIISQRRPKVRVKPLKLSSAKETAFSNKSK